MKITYFRYPHISRLSFSLTLLLLMITTSGLSTATAKNLADTVHLKLTNQADFAWLAFNGGIDRSGVNHHETTIDSGNVHNLKRLWQVHLPDTDSSPVFVPGIKTSKGTKSLLFLNTKKGSLLALNAANGQQIWRRDHNGPQLTTSTPLIDPSHNYVYSYALDGKIHKYTTGSGREITSGGWPETMTLMPDDEKGGTAINIANGYLYMALGGYIGDGGHYQGHVVAVNLATGKKMVFNSLCSNIHELLGSDPNKSNYCADVQSAIWGRAGAVVDFKGGYVYVTTGNGNYNADKGGHDYADTVIKLNRDLSKVLDTYTPADYQQLQDDDADLGSAAPAILPVQSHSRTPYMLVQAGKDRKLRLINRNNMSGQHGPDHVGGQIRTVSLPRSCSVVSHPANWNDHSGTTWIFVGTNCGFMAYKLTTDEGGYSRLQLAYQNDTDGSSPLLANDVLYLQGQHAIRAIDPTTGKILWQDNQIGSLHWQSPLVINGHLYVIDNDGNFMAYSL